MAARAPAHCLSMHVDWRRGDLERVAASAPGPACNRALSRVPRVPAGDLLAAGAEIHEYQPTIYHCKVLIIDSLMGSVGSTNKVLEHAASLIGAQF